MKPTELRLSDLITEGSSRSNPGLEHHTAKYPTVVAALIAACKGDIRNSTGDHPTKAQVLEALGGDMSVEDFVDSAKRNNPSADFATTVDGIVRGVVEHMRRKMEER